MISLKEGASSVTNIHLDNFFLSVVHITILVKMYLYTENNEYTFLYFVLIIVIIKSSCCILYTNSVKALKRAEYACVWSFAWDGRDFLYFYIFLTLFVMTEYKIKNRKYKVLFCMEVVIGVNLTINFFDVLFALRKSRKCYLIQLNFVIL